MQNITRIIFAVALILSGCAPALDLVADTVFPSRPSKYRIETKPGVGFNTTDGILLVADVYLPIGLESAPTILVRIPFSETISNKLRSQVIARHWASRGYAVVIQGTRGRYKSGGNFYPLIHERADGIETLKWVASQPWFDGRLAMWGGSAFGHTQWAIADQLDPGPTALSIQIASTNFRRMFYPGQAFFLESALNWAIRSRGDEDREVDDWLTRDDIAFWTTATKAARARQTLFHSGELPSRLVLPIIERQLPRGSKSTYQHNIRRFSA